MKTQRIGNSAKSYFEYYMNWHTFGVIKQNVRIPSELSDRVLQLLGDRIDYMFYSSISCTEFSAYIADALLGAKGTLGIEVAAALKTMMPVCEKGICPYSIIVTDHANLSELPEFMAQKDGEWKTEDGDSFVAVRGRAFKSRDIITTFEDECYLIILQRVTPGKDIHMDIYKK